MSSFLVQYDNSGGVLQTLTLASLNSIVSVLTDGFSYWGLETDTGIAVTAGSGFAQAVVQDDPIDGTTDLLPVAVKDGSGNAQPLVQPTTPADTQPISAASLPLPSGAATEATLAKLNGFSVPVFDYISLGYTGANLTSVVYKTGGAAGTTVRTLTLAYSGSTLTSVTAS